MVMLLISSVGIPVTSEDHETESIDENKMSTRAPQDDAHGGEWLDSFEDDSEVEWAMSDHLRVDEGNVSISGSDAYDPNLIGLWHFDEGSGSTAFDSSGNNYNGVLINGPSWNSSGKVGCSLDFDGVNDQVDCGDVNDLTSYPFSFTAWICPDTLGENNFGAILTNGGQHSSHDGYLFVLNSQYGLRLAVSNGSAYQDRDKISVIIMGQWQHIAVSVNNSKVPKFYLNGASIGTGAPFSITPTANSYSLLIGEGSNQNIAFDGSIDEVYMYNRVLTATEVKNNYENGSINNIDKGNLTSKPITLPPNMRWDTLMINKTESDTTNLNIKILDATNNQRIPGTPIYTQNGEVDISYIDPIQYPAIKLNATFNGDGAISPELHYWAVSWNRSNTWQDTLFGGEKVESTNNLVAIDGNLQIKKVSSRGSSIGFDPSLVASWNFNEGSGSMVYDATTNNNDGIINGASWTNGISGSSLRFDGVDDHVDCGIDSSVNITQAITLMAWINWNGTSNPSNFWSIIDKASSYWLAIDSNRNYNLGFKFVGGSLGVSVVGGNPLNDIGSWVFIAGTYDGQTMKIFRNGICIGTKSQTGTIITRSEHLWLGDGEIFMNDFFGKIDEAAIYNRSLTAQEIYDIYNNSEYYSSHGNLVSKPITLPSNMCWDTLRINKTVPQDSAFNVTIIDSATNEPIHSFNNLIGTEIDISKINPILHNSIKLQATFGSKGINTSILHDWSINSTENTGPSIRDINAPDQVYRTESVMIWINLSDREEPEEDLTLEIEYKSPADTTWQTSCILGPSYIYDKWSCVFTPLKDAVLGDYSFRITVNDSFRYFYITTYSGIIKVLNNKPTAPDVIISPVEPRTGNDLTVTAENGTDIETSIGQLKYWYRWFKNDTHIPEFDNKTLIESSNTEKDDSWRCVVYSFDSEDIGIPGENEVVIVNTPPEILDPFTDFEMFEDSEVSLEEKLLTMFIDPDADVLIYSST
jgi:hypothetical protein